MNTLLTIEGKDQMKNSLLLNSSSDVSKCPYTKFMNFFKFKEDKEIINHTLPEKVIENDLSKTQIKTNEVVAMCPYRGENKKILSSEDEDESAMNGGCPVRNNIKRDPANCEFEPFFEIPIYGNYDFIFEIKGTVSKEEFNLKTKNIKKMPRHLKYTLFTQDERIKIIRTKEFPIAYFIYDEVKDKGNKLFKQKKYRESLNYYNYAYSMLKWLEFADKERSSTFMKNKLEPIFDSDIVLHKLKLDDSAAYEEDSYRACLVNLLKCYSYTYINLRNYNEAISCLNEAIHYANDRVPDLYFRRSQARMLNKYNHNCEEELELAVQDIETALRLRDDKIFKEHREKLIKLIEEKKNDDINKIRSKINF